MSPIASAGPRNFWDVPEGLPQGAWVQKRRLAAALRELNALCVTTDAPEATLSYAADAATRMVERLAAHPGRTFLQGYAACNGYDDLAVFADRGTLTGQSNPISPMMALAMEGDTAVGHVTFGPAIEGAPGCVHGGMVAAAFDQLFGYLQVRRGVGSLTGELTVRYLQTTPIEASLRFEAQVARVDRRKSFVTARMTAGDVLTAEAEAVFVALDPDKMRNAIAARTKG